MSYKRSLEAIEKFLEVNEPVENTEKVCSADYLENLLLDLNSKCVFATSLEQFEKAYNGIPKDGLAQMKLNKGTVCNGIEIDDNSIHVYLSEKERSFFKSYRDIKTQVINYEVDENCVLIRNCRGISIPQAEALYVTNQGFLTASFYDRQKSFLAFQTKEEGLGIQDSKIQVSSSIVNLTFRALDFISAEELENPWNSTVLLMTPLEPLEQKDLSAHCINTHRCLSDERQEILKRISIEKASLNPKVMEYDSFDVNDFMIKVKTQSRG